MGNVHIKRTLNKDNKEILNKKFLNKKTGTETWLDPTAIGLYFKLLNTNSKEIISNKDLAYHFGLNLDTIRKYINLLKEVGYVKTIMLQENNSYTRTHYFLQESVDEINLEKDYEDGYVLGV